MSKTVRMVLYVLSLLTVAGVIAAVIVSGHGRTAEVMSTETKMTENVAQADDGGDAGQTKDEENVNPADATGDADAIVGTEAGSTETAETEKTADTEQKTGGDTTLLFTGDVLFANAFKAGYDANGITGVVSEDVLAELNAADILMVNNEFPFSERGEAVADKQFTFRCEPSYAKALTELGVDVVSLANNHTLDYGKEALQDTFTALDGQGILYGGAGDSVERAEEIQVIEANGKKFGFLAVSRVIPSTDWKVEESTPGIFSCYDETRLLELIKEGKENCDFLVVYPHWGVEYEAYPEDYQTRIGQECIDAGAELVVGAHTHCLQGVTFYEDKPIFYSLGNFIFGQTIDRSVIVKVTVSADGEASYQLLPVSAAGGVTSFAEGSAGEAILTYMDGISEAHVGTDGSVE